MKKEKGITLTSLVITIIILLIIASISVFSGTQTIKYAKWNKAKSEMETVQTQVNAWHEEYKDLSDTKIKTYINDIGEELTADKAENAGEEISNLDDYRFLSAEYIKDKFGIDGNNEFIVNIKTRDVILYKGIEYEGEKYYTSKDFNINNTQSIEISGISFDVKQGNGNEVIISNLKLNYPSDDNTSLSKFRVQYKKENASYFIDVTSNLTKYTEQEEKDGMKQEVTKFKFQVVGAGSYTIKVSTMDGKQSDTKIIYVFPVLEVASISPTDWTNQDVTVTLPTAKDFITVYTTDGTAPITSNGTAYSKPFTVSENCTVIYAYIGGDEVDSTTKTIEIANIDKIAPTNTTPTATATTNSITITSKQTDDGGSGIKSVQYSKDGGSTWQSSNKFTGLKQSTAYSIATRTTDNAGNVTISQTASVTTKTIGAVGIASAKPTQWTNGNVIVTLPTESGFITKYTTDGTAPTTDSTTYSAPYTVSSNCTIMYVYTDGTNINTAGTLKVTNIDKTAPTNTQPTATKTTNSITVTNKQTDSGGSGIKTTEYSIDGGKTWQSSNKFTGLKQTTSYTIATRTTDNAGNATTSQTLSVTTGTIGAVGTASINPTGWTNGNVTVTLPTSSGFTTKYTTNGSTPTASSTTYSAPFTVSSNCTIMYVYTDGTNINTAGTLKVTNIDKTAPTNTAPTATKTTNSITVTNKQTDSGGSGIKSVQYSKDGGSTWQSSNVFSGLTQNKAYTIATRTTDNAGNATTSQTLSVTTGTIGAVGTASINPTGWTNGNVTVTLPTSSGFTTKYTTNGSTPTASSTSYSEPFTVSSNCTIMYVYTDGTNINTAGTLKVTNIDKTAPTAPQITAKMNDSSGATYNSGTWTNNNIYVELTSTETQSGIKEYQWYENGEWTTRELFTASNKGAITYTVNRDVTLRFRVVDNVGNISSENTIVAKIDKTAPTNTAPTATHTTNSITVTNKQTDSGGSGIKSVQYSKDGGLTWQSSNVFSGLTQNKAYTIATRTTDNAGNATTSQTLSVTTGTIGAVGTASINPTGWTNGNVTVTLPTSSGFTTKYTTNGSTPTASSTSYSAPFTVSSNCTIMYVYTDGTNINTAGTLKITNIDKTAPTAPQITAKMNDSSGATYNSGTWINNNIYVELTSTETQSGIKEYQWYENGEWTTRELFTASNKGAITYTVNRDVTLRFRVVDNVGNISSENTIVAKIDKTAPTNTAPTATHTTNSITVTSKQTDDGGSAIKKVEYSKDGGSTWQSSNKFTGLKQSTAYSIATRTTDNAGNVTTSQTLSVTTGTIGAVETASINPTGWTNGNVTVTLPTSSGFPTKYTTNGSTPTASSTTYSAPFTVSSNCTIMYVYTDGTNINTAGTLKVTNIDKIAPTNTAPTATKTTNSITVTNKQTDSGGSGIKTTEYSIDGGKTWQSSNKFTGLKQTTSYTIATKTTDNAGNVTTSQTLSVTTGTIGAVGAASQDPTALTSGNVTVTLPTTSGLTTRYTTDGSVPTTSSTAYSTPFTVSENCTVMFIYTDGTNVNTAGTLKITNIDKTNYTITYNLDGGKIINQPTTYKVDTNNFTLPIPTKVGYTFTGWTGSNGTTAQTSVTIVKGSKGNKTYTAQWSANTYTIGYTLDGGTASGNPTSYQITTNTITLNNPTKTGYTFTGWTEKTSLKNWNSGFINFNTGKVEKSTEYPNSVYSEPIYLKANTTYTLMGNSLGGIRWRVFKTDGTYIGNKSLSTTYTATENCYVYILLYEGCTEANRTAAYITTSGTPTTTTILKGSTGNKTYTATWKVNQYTVTCEDYFVDASNNNKVKLGSATKSYDYGTSVSGATWGTDTSRSKYYSNYVYKSASSATVGASGTTVYRRFWAWTDLNIFYANHSTQGGGTVAFSIDGKNWTDVTNEPSTTVEPYGMTYYIKNIRPKNASEHFGSVSSNLTYNSTNGYYTYTPTIAGTSMNIFFDYNTYKIAFNANGGLGSMADESMTYETSKALTANSFTRFGHTFTGWATSANGTKVYDNKQSVKNLTTTNGGTVTLYAVWKEIPAVGTASATPTSWTNGNVTVTLPTSSGFTTKYTTNGSTPTASSTTYSEPFTVSSNCTIMYVYTDGTNINTAGTLKVTNIDKTAPTNTQPTATKTTNSITVTNKQTDSGGSGIKSVQYSKDGGSTWQSSNVFSGLTQNKAYTIATRTTDNAGNATTSQTLSVTTGTIGAVGTASINPTGWTNGNVTVTLPTSSGFTTKYTTNGSTPTASSTTYSAPFTVSSNCTIMYVYTDGTNINTAGTLKVTNIDKTAPTNTAPTATKTTNSITVTNKQTDSGGSGIKSVQYSKDGGSTWQSSNVFSGLTQNKVYTIATRTTDNAGNVTTSQTLSVTTGTIGAVGAASATPTTLTSGNVTVTLPTSSGFTTKYTIDGSNPSTSSTTYSGPFTVSSNCTVKFVYTDGTNINTAGTLKITNIDKTNYTITYNLNGGSVSGNPTTYKVDTSTITLKDPTKSGYTFLGWTGSKDLSGGLNSYTSSSPYVAASRDHILGNEFNVTAGEKYRVFVKGNRTKGSLNLQGGIWYTAQTSGASYDGYNGDFAETGTGTGVFYKDITIPTGKTKGKFYIQLEQSSGSFTTSWNLYDMHVIKVGNTTIPTGSSGNKSYTANWSANSYTISFNGNGGSNGTPITKAYGNTIGPLPTSTRTGYTFNGWYTATSGGTKIETTTKMPSSNTTYYAHWIAKNYTVTYNANGGTGAPANQTATYDSKFTVSTTQPTRTGYTFSGWKDPTGVSSWTNWSGTWKYDNGQYGITNNTLTLTAQWTPKTYTVTYNANGGTGAPANQTATYDSKFTVSTTQPTRTGYTFSGWKDPTGVSSWTNWSGTWKYDNGQYGITNNTLTLTAQWTPKTYTLTYNGNGGTASKTSQTTKYNTAWGALATATRTGYSFEGWYTAASGGTQVTDTTVCKGNTTVYAKWKLITLMNCSSETYSTSPFLGNSTIKRNKVERVNLVTSISGHSTNDANCWDVSDGKNGQILAWYEDKDSDGYYEVTIGQNGGIIANPDSSHLFSYIGYNGDDATVINGIENLNTEFATNMSYMFSECKNLISLDVSRFDTSKVTNMSYMFAGNYFTSDMNLIYLDVSRFDTSNVTNMDSMFDHCSELTSLDVSRFDTSKVTDMISMFFGCNKLTSLNVSNFDTSNVTNMDFMFYECNKLTSLNVSRFDTSNVTNMDSMFNGCSNLTSLDVSRFDTSKVTDMSYMFYECNKLTSLDVSRFDTSKVTNMSYMFAGNYLSSGMNLTSLDVSRFDTSNVTNMDSMFCICNKLTSLDVSRFDTSKVTNMSEIFAFCGKLVTIYAGNKWNTDNVTNSDLMFIGATSLVGGAGTTYNSSHTDKAYAHIDRGTSNPGYFTSK